MMIITPVKAVLATECSRCGKPVEVNEHAAKYVRAGKQIFCAECRSDGRQWTRATYEQYLQTDHWRQTRARALKRAGNKCQLCASGERLQVHHNDYSRLGGELPTDLVVLCDSCHKTYHGVL